MSSGLDELAEVVADLTPEELEAYVLTTEADEADAALLRRAWQRRSLLPHQREPEGDWLTWCLMGGRGSGKTYSATHWLYDHVNGPACIPNVPGGHRVNIIAPTLGDAIESCVRGPSGLSAIDPAIKAVSGVGGIHVRFPNGVEGKVLGASSPEDVERMRAAGNTCIAADTPVLTDQGPVPIQEIRPGMAVLTRKGYRTVRRLWENGRALVSTITTTNGRVLRATSDHLVAGEGVWSAVGAAKPGDRIWVWHDGRSSTGSCSTNGRAATSRTVTPGSSIATSGNVQTGRSRPSTTSIISTTTGAITPWTTSSWSAPLSITPCMVDSPTSGTPPEAELPQRPEWRRQPAVQFRRAPVVGPITEGSATTARSAAGAATISGTKASARSASVPTAARLSPCSRPSFDAVAGGFVLDSVATVEHGVNVVPVYDLEVDGVHEYVAGGVVVHNCAVLAEELAAWVRLDSAWDHMSFGLRLGPRPRVVAATTPKARRKLRDILADPTTAITRATTADNPYLEASVRARLYERYGNTSLGRQELEGQLLEEVEGALWRMTVLEQTRVEVAPEFVRCAVAVDPSGSGATTADECGIVVGGRSADGHLYVVEDLSLRTSPDAWARVVVDAYHRHEADVVVAERNYGGEMVEALLRTVDPLVNYRPVTATRGKAIRAEPVSALWEQGKASLVGLFPSLEDELTTWVQGLASPNRLDALVWLGTELILNAAAPADLSAFDAMLR